ncbi:MAG TPA: sigma 54-interacting transcriptional regulator, partial [Gemmatimonadaceae bacterium]|nr:sigma 54-interacting transcriptional regulator [Gemmatimonadaceae bacterium]
TNRDLQEALTEGELREDLYYRLAVVELYLPPLRERMGDLRLLATEFLARFSQQNGKKVSGFDDAAMDWILSYHWPGNVRELKNAVERAVIMSRAASIGLNDVIPRHLRNSTEAQGAVSLPVGSTLADARRQLTLKTLSMTGGDVERTAHMLGTTPGEVRAELAALVEPAEDDGEREAAARNVKSYGSVKDKGVVRQKSKGRR